MPATFPSINPTWGAKRDVQAKVLRNNFGDGYSQRAAQGLNNQAQVWDLSFTKTHEVIDTIENFLKVRKGTEAFYWTPPRESSPLLFTCAKYGRSVDGPVRDTLSATFEQVFDIV